MRSGRIGDSKVAVFESAGGRPEIAGDVERTQMLLMQVVQGKFETKRKKRALPTRMRGVRTRRHATS